MLPSDDVAFWTSFLSTMCVELSVDMSDSWSLVFIWMACSWSSVHTLAMRLVEMIREG